MAEGDYAHALGNSKSTPDVVIERSKAPASGGSAAGSGYTYNQDNFPYEQFFNYDASGIQKWDNTASERKMLWDNYVKQGGTWTAAPPAYTGPSASASDPNAQIVAGSPKNAGQINVTDYSSALVKDPSLMISGDSSMVEQNKNSVMGGNEAGTNINGNKADYQNSDIKTDTAQVTNVSQASQVDPREAQTYEAEKTKDDVADADMEAAQGTVSQNSQINAPQIDTKAIAEATDAGGVGKALSEWAAQDLNEVDDKATVKGQLEALQEDFVDPATGEPRIPVWAAETARSVGRITAFTGQSGSAATASMAQAIMESSIPIATADAQFFQTLTIQNLSNKQASIINRANVLSNMELANQDARVTAAVENAKSFLQMDLANLNNEQQARVINNQNRVNSILEDAKAVNTQRMFTAQSQNEMDKFYDQLNSSIDQFNTSQVNGMKQFNTSEVNSMAKFNSEMENNRDQFYANMQFNIDAANAKWRQTVTLQEDAQAFEAAAQDVKNRVGLSTEQLNQIWDRSDALLQYAWQSGENAADRKAQLAAAQLQSAAGKEGGKSGLGKVAGALAGSMAGELGSGIGKSLTSLVTGLFG